MAAHDRIDARLARDQKRLIERAAELSGHSVASFVVSSAIENAHRVIAGHTRTTLSLENARRLLEILDNTEPTPGLLKAARRHKARRSRK